MLDFLMVVLAFTQGGGSAPAAVQAPEPAALAAPAPAPTPELVAEPQVATGRFLTALEVKPILTATKMNWVAVREFDGQDLLYVTHLWAWRCGLLAMQISVNEGPMRDWPLPACHDQTAQPNAILETDGLPYERHALGSIAQVTVQITYDDLTTDTLTVDRAMVLMP